MTEIPNTFCPAKWDELILNLDYNYVFTCCKAKPTIFKDDYLGIIKKQRENLINGVQDPSCEYCWKIESDNKPSRRTEYLKFFDKDEFEKYKNLEKPPKILELYIGNECNFQCTYCNPKFSSKWEADVKIAPYKIFTDRFFYGIDEKKLKTDLTKHNVNIIRQITGISQLSILGGEPLINKNFWEIIEAASVDTLVFSTNLSCEIKILDKLFVRSKKFKKMVINVSIDATEQIAEFVRYGLNFDVLTNNLEYIINNAPNNIQLNFHSVMTSTTIKDLENFILLVDEYKERYPSLLWEMSYCRDPRIHSFSTLPDDDKEYALKILDTIKDYDYVKGIDTLRSALKSSAFNRTMYSELRHFMNEFATRKNIKIPVCLN